MNNLKQDEIRQAVRQQYGRVAESESGCCGTACCGTTPATADSLSQALGYSANETSTVPEGANMSAGPFLPPRRAASMQDLTPACGRTPMRPIFGRVK